MLHIEKQLLWLYFMLRNFVNCNTNILLSRMKLLAGLFSFMCLFLVKLTSAQNTAPEKNNAQSSTCIHCSRFFVSKPMRDLPDYKSSPDAMREASDKRRRNMHPNNTTPLSAYDYTDPLRQTNTGSAGTNIDVPIVDFPGTTDFEFPGDPNGAVDSTYYVQTINVSYTVFDKVGNVVMPAKDLGSLWAGDPQDGDPVVLYDKFADRWLITEFQITNVPYQFCVALSKTNDPTGAFYVWQFNIGSIDPDYPKYAIWNNGYYITFQGFNGFNPIVPQEMAVLERNRMLKGSPSAAMIIANLPSSPAFQGGNNSLFTAPKVLDCDASALPPFNTPDYVLFFENIASGGYSNSIIMDSLVVDTTAHTFRIAKADSFAVPTFNAYFTNGSDGDITQPGDPNGVDALDGTFNFRTPWMKFPGYNSVVLSNTVNLGGLVAGIRWYELRETAGVWSVYQNGTYGPADGVSRWNGAICQDYDGNIAMEYSVASSSVYPGIRYTGRHAADPLGQMTFGEQTAIAGNGTLSGTSGRWGDYSQLDIDPADGITFWGINQYGDASSNSLQLNRIFSFKLEGTVSGIEEVKNQAALNVYQNGSLIYVKATGLPGNDELLIDLFDISGRQLATQHVTPVSNSMETQMNVSALPKGVYFVRIGKENFQRVAKIEVN